MKRQAVSSATVAVGTTETVVATVPMPMLGDNPLISGVIIDGVINMTLGTTQTSVAIRVRRGALAGTQVGATVTAAAAAATAIPSTAFSVLDASPVSGQSYVITAQQAGGAGNATGSAVVVSATAA